MENGEKRQNKWWSEGDTFALLALIEELGLVRELDKKRQRNDSHFKRLRHTLAKRNIDFTVNQIRNRWKSLKHKYRKIKTVGYRSGAAKLSAIESFRYFKKLDRMLARRPKPATPPHLGSDNLVVLSASELEDHIDSDPQQPSRLVAWDPLSSGPEVDVAEEDVKDPHALPVGLKTPAWESGEEIVTLGPAGEYLFPVKTSEQQLSPAQSIGGSTGPHCTSSTPNLLGGAEDANTLILQQLTLLNQQLEEQMAEQRAFHCSVLGMLDRQIEVLQQLSNNTRMPHRGKRESCPSQQVHGALVHIMRGVEQARAKGLVQSPSRQRPLEAALPVWSVPLLGRNQGSFSSALSSTNENPPRAVTSRGGKAEPSRIANQLLPAPKNCQHK
ncbi:uncharacterized protein LOC121304829 [Polyodon spathula]|uniref:uncharacterized protein LOC121304829 n=1 Tax=Polyodon spathula TaxID=7913 RepID=UPI001B7DD829|nr:uncharacterized protein LOC121304829 [Polyodon spathula]